MLTHFQRGLGSFLKLIISHTLATDCSWQHWGITSGDFFGSGPSGALNESESCPQKVGCVINFDIRYFSAPTPASYLTREGKLIGLHDEIHAEDTCTLFQSICPRVLYNSVSSITSNLPTHCPGVFTHLNLLFSDQYLALFKSVGGSLHNLEV